MEETSNPQVPTGPRLTARPRPREVVFALGHNNKDQIYDSYKDLETLITLSGFKIIRVHEIDFSQNILYIVSPLNGESYYPHNNVSPIYDNNKNKEKVCSLALWALERPQGHGATFSPMSDRFGNQFRLFDYVIVSDRHWYNTLIKNPSFKDKARYLVLGSHPDLPDVPVRRDKAIFDFIHLSYLTHRRSIVYDGLIHRGLSAGPNGWGGARSEAINHSRILLNIHQDSMHICEPLRFAIAAAHRIPVFSEKLEDSFPFTHLQDYVDIGEYENWTKIHAALPKNVSYEPIGQRLFDLLCNKYRFDKTIKYLMDNL
jgi:hypothetical protein